jgi:MinD superfamily P-loop ATPase
MQIAIASGKGGTGKTTLAVALALAWDGPVQLLDCDVEEPNAALFLTLENQAENPVSVPVPAVDSSRCTGCGKCAKICQFNALAVAGKSVLVFTELCHSCGGCVRVCPEKAITEVTLPVGTIRRGQSGNIGFMEGRLKIGRAMAPPVIRAVKKSADPELPVLIDCPPGTSCPMITAVKGSDFVILVTEPTPFGLHDLKLAVETVRMLNIPFGVVINRSDAGDNRVVEYCKKENIRLLLQIPESRKIAEAYSRGEILLSTDPALKGMLQEIIRSFR